MKPEDRRRTRLQNRFTLLKYALSSFFQFSNPVHAGLLTENFFFVRFHGKY